MPVGRGGCREEFFELGVIDRAGTDALPQPLTGKADAKGSGFNFYCPPPPFAVSGRRGAGFGGGTFCRCEKFCGAMKQSSWIVTPGFAGLAMTTNQSMPPPTFRPPLK